MLKHVSPKSARASGYQLKNGGVSKLEACSSWSCQSLILVILVWHCSISCMSYKIQDSYAAWHLEQGMPKCIEKTLIHHEGLPECCCLSQGLYFMAVTPSSISHTFIVPCTCQTGHLAWLRTLTWLCRVSFRQMRRAMSRRNPECSPQRRLKWIGLTSIVRHVPHFELYDAWLKKMKKQAGFSMSTLEKTEDWEGELPDASELPGCYS